MRDESGLSDIGGCFRNRLFVIECEKSEKNYSSEQILIISVIVIL